MKCLNCERIIKQTGNRKRLFCDDKCRKAHNRKVESGHLKADKSKADTPKADKQPEFNGYSAQDLYDEIRAYPYDTWKDSPAYLELRKRLDKWSVKRLIEEGYYIPNWKKPSVL